ncbi:MAG: hypothetical protein ACWA40_01585 [Planktomarina sp.]
MTLAQDAPLSAIDWLGQPVQQQSAPVAPSAPVQSPQNSAVGLFDPAPLGFGPDFWLETDTNTYRAFSRPLKSDVFPSMKRLRYSALLARLPGDEHILRQRVQALYDLGALELAWALIGQDAHTSTQNFALAWNIGLLIGKSDELCTAWAQNPQLLPKPEHRIYCLSQGQNWQAAVTLYFAHDALGTFDPRMQALLAAYLEPELEVSPDDAIVPAGEMTPFLYVLLQNAGYTSDAQNLPLPFAAAVLRTSAPWRSRLHAAERLAQVGSLTPNELLGLYIEQTPAASGSIWDRAKAVQTLRQTTTDEYASNGQARTLWNKMQDLGLTSTVAEIFGPDWSDLEAGLDELPILQKFAILSGNGNLSVSGDQITLRLWRENLNFGSIETRKAILIGLTQDAPNAPATAKSVAHILQDIGLYLDGDYTALTRVLIKLRQFGMADAANHLAREAMILEPRKS